MEIMILEKINARIKARGGTLYFVGGLVRDQILGRETNDIDLLVCNISKDDLENVLASYNPVFCGASFGVYKIGNYDIAMPRTEKSVGLGHKDFNVSLNEGISIAEDLRRRDFTINAIAREFGTNNIIDPFNGIDDIRNKLIKKISAHSIKEDYLRALRAIQFAARLDFNIEASTLEMISEHKNLLSTISTERIQVEFNKLLLAKNIQLGFGYMLSTGLLEYLVPHLFKIQKKSSEDYFNVLNSVTETDMDITLRLALLFQSNNTDTISNKNNFCVINIVNEARQFLNKLKYSNSIKNSVLAIISNTITETTNFVLKKSIGMIGETQCKRILIYNLYRQHSNAGKIDVQGLLSKIEKLISSGEALSLSDLAIDGNDLLSLGIQGQAIGKTLNSLLDMVLKQPSKNTKKQLLQIAQNN